MDESAKDVTQRIIDRHIIYGGSDNTNPNYLSSNRSLNYAEGGSIQSPQQDRVSIIPYTLGYSDEVGLFGKENHFVKITLQIDPSVALDCFEEPGWRCGNVERQEYPTVNTYVQAIEDPEKDLTVINDYTPASIGENKLRSTQDAYVSVDLNNLKTGNKYIDSWFDVRLYSRSRNEHPYDKMYVRLNDSFYIGFHARNTRRLPYNVKCVIGQEYFSGLEEEDMRYINRS